MIKRYVLYDFFFLLLSKVSNPIALYYARVNPDLASLAPVLSMKDTTTVSYIK